MKKLVLIALLAAFAAVIPAAGAGAVTPEQRVIAQLALPGDATPEQIAAATDDLLASLPAGSYTLNNRYSTLPYVALSAGPIALSVLQQSNLVAGVFSDGVVSAASKNTKKCKRGKKHHAKKACKKNAATKNSVS